MTEEDQARDLELCIDSLNRAIDHLQAFFRSLDCDYPHQAFVAGNIARAIGALRGIADDLDSDGEAIFME